MVLGAVLAVLGVFFCLVCVIFWGERFLTMFFWLPFWLGLGQDCELERGGLATGNTKR